MKTKLFLAAVLSVLFCASCTVVEQEGPGELRTIISASVSSTKTALGAKDNSVWPNYWKTGDQIMVNGATSDAIGEEADGKSTAYFTFEGVLSTPYYAAYPVSAISGYSDGKATVTVPASQSYVAGSYDPAAFVMAGVSSSKGSVSLSPLVSVIHISLQGSASISSIMLTGAEGAALSGSLSTDFASCEPATVSNEVQLSAATAVALPAEFFVCVPAGLAGQVAVDIYDNEGGSMSKEITIKSALEAGKVYSPAAIEFVPVKGGFPIKAEGITSSTAVICWEGTPENAYTVAVYSDKGCNTLVDSYAIDAGDACWGGKAPRFCVSGLAAGTTYYVRVSDDTSVSDSMVLPVRTADFQVVEISETPVAEGDVLLAEDFSELRWDCDLIGSGAGWFPTEAAQMASFSSLEVASYQAAETSNEKQLSSQAGPVAASRLAHWAQGANRNIYIHPGYLKLVGSSKVTHIVTPAFNNIPEGMEATLEVEVTASAYYSESSASFATTNAVVAVQRGEFDELTSNGTNTLDLESNVQPITLAEELAWHSYKVTVTGVAKGDRLAFGAAKNVTKNNARMNISDIKVTVKAIGEPAPPTLSASFVAASSSTAVFSWTYGGSADFDISRPYKLTLATDRVMLHPVVTYEIPAGASCWDGKKPSFVFGGLNPKTTYYFMVEDLTEGASAQSNIASGKTEEFTVVEPGTVRFLKLGDVILAEDFSEIGWGSENVVGGAGYIPSEKVLCAPSGDLSTETGAYTPAASTARRLYGDAHVTSDDRLFKWGFYGNSAVYAQAAALRLCTSASGARTSIVSPVLVDIPEGKKATIDVTVTAAMYNDDANDVAVYVERDSDLTLVLAPDQYDAAKFSSEGGKYNGEDLLSEPHPLGITKREWTTKTVQIENVVNTDRLVIGTAENIDTKNRFFLSDVSVTLVSVEEMEPAAEVKATSSSTIAFSWGYPTHPYGKDYDKTRPYRASLYSDAGCSSLVVSHEFEAEASCWNSKQPCFSFGGLAPATTYYLVVEDTANGKKTEAVSATTEAFTAVDATTVSNAAVGDVILAEDFSEINWGPDEFAEAAGFVPSPKDLLPHVGASPAGSFDKYNGTGNRIFGTGVDLGESRLSKGWGFFGNSAAYLRNAYLRVATTTGRTHIVTPGLVGIPEGKLATIEVEVTATKHESNANDVAVFVERELKLNAETDPGSSNFRKYTGAALDGGYALSITTVKDWETKTVSISGIEPGDQLVIGSLENISGKDRFSISDVKVTITDLVDDPVFAIKNEATLLAFAAAVNGGNTTQDAKLKASVEVSPAGAEAFQTIEGYAGTFDGKGYTIAGLTKPMFNVLEGTVKKLTVNSTLNITADQLDLGILANVLSGTADGCTSQGSVTFNVAGGVTGEHHIGGLIGKAAASGATVKDCKNEASVTNDTASASGNGDELMVGGVLALFWGSQFTISDCTNTGEVTNNAYWNKDISVGGIIGQSGNGDGNGCTLEVSDCTNGGTITNNGDCDATTNVGGLIGWGRYGTFSGNTNNGEIYNNGDASENYIGGVFGNIHRYATFDDNTNNGEVFNYGEASSINYVGGLIGRAYRNNTFKDNANTGDVHNFGDATNSTFIYVGGIVGYLDKDNAISDAGSSAKYKLSNSGDIENAGSAKNICIGGLFGRNSSGYFNMTGTSSKYSINSGNITDTSGPSKSNGGDLCIGGIAGYTTTGIKTQYARNTGHFTVHGDKGNTSVNIGGIGGWISNAQFNFNNCRNYGDITVDCTTTASMWVAGIVGCPKNNNTTHYYWYSNSVIDTHAATVGGENYTAGLMATPEGNYSSSYKTFTMYGHKVAGVVWGSKTTTGLFCCTKNTAFGFSLQGGADHPNTIAPGTVRKDNVNDNTVNSIEDVTIGILAGGEGSSMDITSAIDGSQIAVAEW